MSDWMIVKILSKLSITKDQIEILDVHRDRSNMYNKFDGVLFHTNLMNCIFMKEIVKPNHKQQKTFKNNENNIVHLKSLRKYSQSSESRIVSIVLIKIPQRSSA